jgi:transposase
MYPHELHLIQVDNAQAHSAQTLTVPNNIILLFQSPYCREVNPIERVGLELKQWLQWQHFDSIADLQQAISRWVNRLTPRRLQSLTQWGWLVDGLCVAGI